MVLSTLLQKRRWIRHLSKAHGYTAPQGLIAHAANQDFSRQEQRCDERKDLVISGLATATKPGDDGFV